MKFFIILFIGLCVALGVLIRKYDLMKAYYKIGMKIIMETISIILGIK